MGFVAVVNVFACVVGLLFIFEMFYRNHLKRENEIIKELRREESAQYKMSKKTIDLINIKVHDFRHQIRKIGRAENINGATIENISNLIHIYDSSIKTSNSALNVILSEKSLYCSENGIKFSVIADGDTINFMSEEDTYSLFGNINDNAIDAVIKLPEDQRMIRLKITKTGNMVSVSEKNSYAGELQLVDGLPKTTKEDSNHHGYGMKSIRMITSKYNGTMEIDLDDNLFNISLLFIVK
jgi:sensor histidine kinase regulating citrate/malate metabolism